MSDIFKRNIVLIVFAAIALTLSALLSHWMLAPKLMPGESPELVNHKDGDTLLIADQYGYVNVDMFIQLLNETLMQEGIQGAADANRKRLFSDSIEVNFPANAEHIVYGDIRRHKDWSHYRNSPISTTESSFTARCRKEDGVLYMQIPYQLLVNIINRRPDR